MQAARGASLSDADTPAPARRGRRVAVLVGVAVLVYVIDQVTKVIAAHELAGREPVVLLGGLLKLTLVRNPGAAFGIAGGATIIFSVVAVVVAVAILRTAPRLRSTPWAVALGLLLGGAMGNLTDRLVRDPAPLRGRVVDFLELPHWPVFNGADSAIVCGAVLIAVLAATGRQLDGTRTDG
ncbi:MAG: signal peptidase II [Motilibacteraceae bacterium]